MIPTDAGAHGHDDAGRPGKAREIEFLVLSSHKTATQTVRRSLARAGRAVAHFHTLKQPESPVAPGSLREFAAMPGAPRLQVVSVYREPVGRLVSSMFQWHGVGVLRSGEVDSPEQTLIHRLAPARLRDFFIEEYVTSWGARETIPEVATEVGVPVAGLHYDDAAGFGTTRFEHLDVHLMRFDRLVAAPARLLSAIAGAPVVVKPTNRAEDAWYAPHYRRFLQDLALPVALVERVYEERRALVERFHPEGFDGAVAAARERYGAGG